MQKHMSLNVVKLEIYIKWQLYLKHEFGEQGNRFGGFEDFSGLGRFSVFLCSIGFASVHSSI